MKQRRISRFTFVLTSVVVTCLMLAGCDQLSSLLPGGPTYTAEQIERGRYLVLNVSTCADCHTPRLADGSPDLELLLAGTEFIPGLLSAPNLTPDKATGLGNRTDEQIIRAIREGVGHFEDSPDGEPLSPIMPYYVYGNMTVEDAQAIVAFLRSLSPIENETPERSPQMAPPAPAPILDYASLPGDDSPGKYLTSAAGACIECHTSRIEAEGPPDPSRLDPSKYFAGGEEFAIPGLQVFSTNLTPDPDTGLGNWTDEQIRQALQEGKNPEGQDVCPPMPAYRGLHPDDVDAIIAYLRSLPAIQNEVPECQFVAAP